MKQCIKCGIKKPLSKFYKDIKRIDGRRSDCKICHKNDGLKRAVKQKYGITYNEFLNIKQKQHNKCAICNNVLVSGIKTHIDHCHKTDHVRGVLCNNCNRGIGYLKDSTNILKAAILYLDKHANKETS